MNEKMIEGKHTILKNQTPVLKRTAAGQIRIDGLLDELNECSPNENWTIESNHKQPNYSVLTDDEKGILDIVKSH
jgi:hypothetical protein